MKSEPLTPFRDMDRVSKLLLLAAVALLVPIMSKSLSTLYDRDSLPFKPRDYTLLMLAASSVLLFLSRPRFSLLPFLLFVPSVLRIVDSAFLERFSVSYLGEHSVFVMNLISAFLVSSVAVLLLGARYWREIAIWVSVLTILLVNGSVYYEAAGFADFTRIDGRMSGLPIDPNDPPITSCLLLGILYTLQPRFWWNMALTAFSAPAIALTLSRSGMAIFIILVGAYVVLNLHRHFTGMVLAGVAALPVAAVGITLLAQRTESGMVKDANTSNRLQAIYELDFEKLKSPERAKDLADGWEGVTQSPMWGHGTGSGNTRWMPHNQVLAVWLDIGLVGMLAYVVPLLITTGASVAQGLKGIYCLIPVWLYIPCSQTLLDTPKYWLCYAVAVCVLFPKRYSLIVGSLRDALRSPRPAQHQSPATP